MGLFSLERYRLKLSRERKLAALACGSAEHNSQSCALKPAVREKTKELEALLEGSDPG